MKISYQSTESLFLNNPPFSLPPPFPEKIFYPHPYCQIRVSQSKGGGGRGFELWQKNIYPFY